MSRKKMKVWKFGQVDLRSTVVSDFSKISARLGSARLVRNELTRLFPTDSSLSVRLPTKTVPRLKSWDLIQVVSTLPKSLDGSQSTTIKARIHDGTNAYYWNGVAWAITTTQWNSLSDIQTNLSAWQNTTISFEFELKTTDGKVTPIIEQVKLLYSVDLQNQYVDWVYDTVIAAIQDNVKPMSNMLIDSDNSSTIDLSQYDLGSDYDIVSIEGVFNQTTDPNFLVNLSSNYNQSSKVITLSAPQTFGHQLFVMYRYKPQVSYQASQDYTEVASLPAIVFDDISYVDKGEAPSDDHIMNTFVDPPVAVILPAPRRYDIVFNMDVIAPMTTDMFMIQEEFIRFIEARPTIASAACGDDATFTLETQFAQASSSPMQDIYRSRATFKLENLYLQTQDVIETSSGSGKARYGVKSVNMTTQFNNNTKTTSIT